MNKKCYNNIIYKVKMGQIPWLIKVVRHLIRCSLNLFTGFEDQLKTKIVLNL